MDNDSFNSALCCLTPRLKKAISALLPADRAEIREIRLRANKPVIINRAHEPCFILESGRLSGIYSKSALSTDMADIQQVFNALCGYSVHSCQNAVNSGYITIEGGHRAGVCGTAVCSGGKITAVRDVSCINLRIARQVIGAADELYTRYFSAEPVSMIIAGAPSSGKTTVLRDLARRLSCEADASFAQTVICDERGEIAAAYRGVAQNNVGMNCDVLTGYPKGEAIMTALRSFSPQVIICDEVGSASEVDAIKEGLNSGVKFVVSVHASTGEELIARLQIRELLETREFDYAALLEGARTPCKIKKVYKVGDLLNEAYCSCNDNNGVLNARGLRSFTLGGKAQGA